MWNPLHFTRARSLRRFIGSLVVTTFLLFVVFFTLRTIVAAQGATGVFKGTVYAPDGTTPVEGALVTLWDGQYYAETTDASGRFTITAEAGAYTVTVDPPAQYFGQWLSPPEIAVFITAGVTMTKDFTFTGAASVSNPKMIRVTVQRETGVPVTDAVVSAFRPNDPAFISGTVGANGTVTLTAGPGTWDVWVGPTDPDAADWDYSGFPQSVFFEDTPVTETATLTFTVGTPTSALKGTLKLKCASTCQATCGTASVQDVTLEAYNDSGLGNTAVPDATGAFTISVYAGVYRLFAWTDIPYVLPPGLSGPFAVDGVTDIGEICLEPKNARITGRITRGTGQGTPRASLTGVPNVDVYAWDEEGRNFAFAQTDANGFYTLTVSAGFWTVEPWVPFGEPYRAVPGAEEVFVADNNTQVPGVDFSFVEENAVIQGRVVFPDGSPAEFFGAAFAQTPGQDPWGDLLDVVPVEFGQFEMKLAAAPGERVDVGLFLPPEEEGSVTPYTQTVTFGAGAAMTQTVTFTVTQQKRVITGTLVVNGQPVTVPVQGEVYGVNPDTGAFRSTPFVYQNGRNVYTLTVFPGTWLVNYIIYDGPLASPGAYTDTVVTVSRAARQVQAGGHDVEAKVNDATIRGLVLAADGATPVSDTLVYAANTATGIWKSANTDAQGRFTLTLPSGSYRVGAAIHPTWDMDVFKEPAPVTVVVNPTGQTPDPLTLQFRKATVLVTGQVLSGTTPLTDTTARVWAWSEDGGAQAESAVDAQGRYTLTLVANTTWRLGANWIAPDGTLWRATERVISVGTTPLTGQDLTLQSTTVSVPEAMAFTFDATKPFKVVLDDGTEIDIPARALADKGQVTLYISPQAREMRDSADADVLDYAYALHATEVGTNKGLNGPFKSPIIIKFRYDPDRLPAGMDERSIRPAYYSTVAQAWIVPAGYTVDTERNLVVMEIQHFTRFALMGSRVTPPGPTQYRIHLPLVVR